MAADRKWNADLMIALAAMLTAVVAVVVAVVQTDIMREEAEMEREHARLSVMPSAMLFYSNGTDTEGRDYFELNIINNGLGPAIIEDFSIVYDGKHMRNQRHWVETVAGGRDVLEAQGVSVNNSGAGPGVSIPAGERLDPIRVYHSEFSDQLRQAAMETTFSLCFCSFYGDCQVATGLGGRPQRVDSCRREPEASSGGTPG